MANLTIIDNISEISKSTMNNFMEKSFSDTLPADFNSNISFPLNNAELNWLITETNYNLSQGLTNMFFLEFDVSGSEISKDHLSILQDINNDFVEKEIHFVLNV